MGPKIEKIHSEILTNEFYGLPTYYKLHSSRRFFYRESSLPLSVYNAQRFCEDHVGRLPTWTSKAYLPLPLSEEENEFIREIVPGKSLWIAMHWMENDYWSGPSEWGYNAKFQTKSTEGIFELRTVYTNWRSGDGVLEGLSGNRRAIISPSDGKWLAAGAYEEHYAVCIFRF